MCFKGACENAAMLSGAEWDEEKGAWVMPKDKKSALSLACDDHAYHCWKEGKINCDNFSPTFGGIDVIDQDKCSKCWEEHYRLKAEIPDGWDVVKMVYKDLSSELINQQFDKSWSGFQVWITHEIKNLGALLEQAGMGVN